MKWPFEREKLNGAIIESFQNPTTCRLEMAER